ncbi:DUF4097 family beta strand repeat protein [candidate division WOR-3 bacterium]|nr:DUF4097 family beta strand repeat protein [candidate division WOR-3 bacterium]
MKRILVLTSAVLIATALSCYDGNVETQTEYREYDATLFSKVEIHTENGDITTSVSADSMISLTLIGWASGITDRVARDHISEIEVSVVQDTTDSILKVYVTMPHNVTYNIGCNAELELPESLYVNLETSNGNIEADGHQVGMCLHTSNGDINTEDTRSDAEIETSNGSLEVKLHTGNIRGETSNGSVTADVVMPDSNGTCIFSSSNGNITVAVPDSVSAEVRLKTSNGGITIEGLELGDFNPDDDIFESTLGDGSGEINLETSNGHVRLKKL